MNRPLIFFLPFIWSKRLPSLSAVLNMSKNLSLRSSRFLSESVVAAIFICYFKLNRRLVGAKAHVKAWCANRRSRALGKETIEHYAVYIASKKKNIYLSRIPFLLTPTNKRARYPIYRLFEQ